MKKRNHKILISVFALSLLALLPFILTACNTITGVGEDVSSLGRAMGGKK